MNETCIKHALNMPNVNTCPYCLLEMYRQSAVERDEVIAEIDTKRIILVNAMRQFANNEVGIGWLSKFAKETLSKVGEEI